MSQRRIGLLLVLPAVAVFLLLFIAPLIYGAWLSLHEARFGRILPGLTLRQYEVLFTNPTYTDALARTFRLSGTATVLALLLGYPLAYALAFKLKRMGGIITIIILAPLLMNVVVRTLGWVIILGRSGLINNVSVNLGFGEFILLYTETAVLIGYVQVFLPFMVLSILASLQTMDLNLIKASSSLGATPATTFWKVLFPLSLPGVLSGSIIVFSLSSGVFVLPAMLGGTNLRVLSLLAYQQTTTTLNFPLGAAAAFLLLTIVLLVVLITTFLVERTRFREVFRRASA
ncbi:MAG: ABC transporter permease [Salinarimonadaceae bacterium]|nr:MAG: ABC transporter permease [Salinarimonadaceae bacterium]